MKKSLSAGVIAIALFCGASALATPVLDQSQYGFNTGFPYDFGNYPNYPVAQSFTAGLDGLLTNITISSNGEIQSAGSLTMDIRAGDGVGGAVLGSLSTNYPFPQSYDYGLNLWLVSIDVSSLGINVFTGSQYTFLFTNVTGSDFPYRGILAANYNPYAGGRAYSGPGYGEYVAPWDLVFTTSVDQNVPDSGSVLLMLAGSLAMLVGFRRSR